MSRQTRNDRAATGEQPTTPSELYNEQYFLTACEGYEGWEAGEEGDSPRLLAALALAAPWPGERMLDVGCGRGEAVLSCARKGAQAYGIDYSRDALHIARRCVNAEGHFVEQHAHLARADAKRLPFRDDSFDKLLMFDLVEHLYPWELTAAFREAWRVLAPEGALILHTAPNRWYYRFGYPLYRLFERLRGLHLPANPRDRFPFHHLHVNEQDPLRLRGSLREAGFAPRVWLGNVQSPLPGSSSPLLKLVVAVLLTVYPFRWVFRNDLFAVAQKRGEG